MKGEPISKLKKIKVKDNGEPLVDLKRVCPRIVVGYEQLGLKLTKRPKRVLYVRKTVAKMLKKSSKAIAKKLSI